MGGAIWSWDWKRQRRGKGQGSCMEQWKSMFGPNVELIQSFVCIQNT